MPARNTIAPDALVRPIGVPSAPTMIDVRDVAMSQRIPGSFIRHQKTVAEWSTAVRNRAVIMINGDGTKAHGVAAWLRGSTPKRSKGAWQGGLLPVLPVIDTTHLPPYEADGRPR